jgi:uncharacterized protein with von Willebrand factor type A (vWA) domain
MEVLIPEEWLRRAVKKHLSDAERARLEKLGWEKLMETFRQRLAEQKERHSGGSKWIGSGGSSPFGHGGTHPEGIRLGGRSENRSAVKVWERREYRNLDDSVELGTRNIKVALRRLRRFAREGAAEELDLEGTIAGTARNAGWLDLKLRPERHNAVKVLLLLDIGGSMDDHIRVCEELVLRLPQRVQAPRTLLLPQLCLRSTSGATTAGATANASRRTTYCTGTAATTS